MTRDLINKLQGDYPELALKLNLQAVQSINNLTNAVDLEDIGYEFMT